MFKSLALSVLLVLSLVSFAQPAENVAEFDQATAAIEAGNFTEADSLLEICISKNGDEGNYWFYSSMVKGNLGDLDGAIKAMKRASEIYPDNGMVFEYLGQYYFKAGKHDEGLEAYLKGADLAPADDKPRIVETLNALTTRYYNEQSYKHAKAFAKKSLELDNTIGRTHYFYGACCVKDSEYDLAKKHLEKFVELSPDDPNVELAKEMLSHLEY